MPIHPWPHLLKRLKKGQCLLGLDVGSKTIGLAISDPSFLIASPLETIARSKVSREMDELSALAGLRGVGGFIIGLPLGQNGERGESARRSELFAQQMIEAKIAFAEEPHISFYDERFSTQRAEHFLIEELDLSRKRRDAVIDKMAAQIILQDALDSLKTKTGS